jgi:hypothetical protein
MTAASNVATANVTQSNRCSGLVARRDDASRFEAEDTQIVLQGGDDRLGQAETYRIDIIDPLQVFPVLLAVVITTTGLG